MRSVSSNSRSAWSYATRSAYIAGSRTTAFTSLVRARSSANESFLSETTRTIQGPTSASSRSAWRLVPRPEASTATRAFTPARYGPAVTRVKHERLNPNARIWAVPVDEKSTKSGDRCDLHPASPSVAECQSCGRPLCLPCAVPVRGRVLGVECLEAALGPDSTVVGPRRDRRRARSVGLADDARKTHPSPSPLGDRGVSARGGGDRRRNPEHASPSRVHAAVARPVDRPPRGDPGLRGSPVHDGSGARAAPAA